MSDQVRRGQSGNMSDGSTGADWQPDNHPWAIAVVHGIGNTEPVALIRAVSDTLEKVRPGFAARESTEAIDRMAPGQPSSNYRSPVAGKPGPEPSRWERLWDGIRAKLRNWWEFVLPPERTLPPAQHARGAVYETRKVQIATAYWSDISFYKDGLLNILGGMLLSGFGVRYLTEVAMLRKGPLATPLAIVLRLMVLIMAFLVLPITFVSLMLSSVGLIVYYLIRFPGAADEVCRPLWLLSPVDCVPMWQAECIAVGTFVACYQIAKFAIRTSWDVQAERKLLLPMFSWLVIVAALACAALLVVTHTPANDLPQRLMEDSQKALGTLIGNSSWIRRAEILDRISLSFGLMQALQWVFGVALIVLTGLAVLLLGIMSLPGVNRRPSLRSSRIAVVSVISLWILMLIMFWAENLVTNAAMSLYVDARFEDIERLAPEARKAREVQLAKGALSKVCPTPSRPLRMLVLDSAGEDSRKPGAGASPTSSQAASGFLPFEWKCVVPGRYYPLLWFDIVFLMLVFTLACVVGYLMYVRGRWSRRQKHRRTQKALHRNELIESEPRLVAPTAYVATVLFFMVFVAIWALVYAMDRGGPGNWPGWLQLDAALKWLASWVKQDVESHTLTGEAHRIPHELGIQSEFVRIFVGAGILGFLFVAHSIRSSMKLVLDVCNHFTTPKENFPVRQRIERRLEHAIGFLARDPDDFKQQRKDKPHLLVLAHSQGTVIAVDELFGKLRLDANRRLVLREGTWLSRETADGESMRDIFSSLTVVTFGSPLTHVYQHYFAHLYPSFSNDPAKSPSKLSEGAKDLRQAMATLAGDPRVRWVNFYRVDDFVGTFIEGVNKTFPVNIALPELGGHTRYWADTEEDETRRKRQSQRGGAAELSLHNELRMVFEIDELKHVLRGMPKPLPEDKTQIP